MIDTSAIAVERLINNTNGLTGEKYMPVVADMLRALAAERDALQETIDTWLERDKGKW